MPNKEKNLLFVTWDSDSSNYLESLFFPILKGIQEKGGMMCHVMQFSWADAGEVGRIARVAEEMGLAYEHHVIHRRPLAVLGAFWSVYQGVYFIRQYVEKHDIQILMPRSTMPAMMVNRLWAWLGNRAVKVVFDADGLPLEERIDFAGLGPESRQYKLLKKEERKVLKNAHQVITRSQKSIDFHISNIGEGYRHKFAVMSNGRDSNFFKPDAKKRDKVRKELGVGEGALLWVYTGTLGKPYLVEEMLALFALYHQKYPDSKFLILTRNKDFINGKIEESIQDAVIVHRGEFALIPDFLAAGDVGLSLRKPAPSLAGLSPIKLGEYLLMGLPVIASKRVGDTEELLGGKPFCFLYEKGKEEECLEWVGQLAGKDWKGIREFGLKEFGLGRSVEGWVERL